MSATDWFAGVTWIDVAYGLSTMLPAVIGYAIADPGTVDVELVAAEAIPARPVRSVAEHLRSQHVAVEDVRARPVRHVDHCVVEAWRHAAEL